VVFAPRAVMVTLPELIEAAVNSETGNWGRNGLLERFQFDFRAGQKDATAHAHLSRWQIST
jgi:hypothetical protein